MIIKIAQYIHVVSEETAVKEYKPCGFWVSTSFTKHFAVVWLMGHVITNSGNSEHRIISREEFINKGSEYSGLDWPLGHRLGQVWDCSSEWASRWINNNTCIAHRYILYINSYGWFLKVILSVGKKCPWRCSLFSDRGLLEWRRAFHDWIPLTSPLVLVVYLF